MTNAVRPIVSIALPARDEADRIGACLEAIDSQFGAQVDHIVLVANNCSDRTTSIARGIQLRHGTTLHVQEFTFPPHLAHAGHARQVAMRHAAALAGSDGVVLTTDADGRVDPDWLKANLAALQAGADVVCGWVELDPIEWGQIPAVLHEDDARECAYDILCDRIHALLDPDPADPWPRHTQHSGASIAVTAAAFAACGGVPDIHSGEDRALIDALRRSDMRIRHAPEVHVIVSGRIEGRSPGGMADTIRRRMGAPDLCLDDRLEPAADCARRAASRAALRRIYETGDGVAELDLKLELGLECLLTRMSLSFGEAWSIIEATSPVLRRRRVPVADLPVQVAAAESILAGLYPADQPGSPEHATQIPV
jgi:GT2 family glycosyltransferase